MTDVRLIAAAVEPAGHVVLTRIVLLVGPMRPFAHESDGSAPSARVSQMRVGAVIERPESAVFGAKYPITSMMTSVEAPPTLTHRMPSSPGVTMTPVALAVPALKFATELTTGGHVVDEFTPIQPDPVEFTVVMFSMTALAAVGIPTARSPTRRASEKSGGVAGDIGVE